MIYPLNDVVRAMGNIHFEGNVIPRSWYAHLVNGRGTLESKSVCVLGEIYRLYEIQNGNELIQMSYKDFSEKSGLTINQIRSAIVFLEEKQLIKREFINKIMHLRVNSTRLREITY